MDTPRVNAPRARDRVHGRSDDDGFARPQLTHEQLLAMSMRSRHDWLATTGHLPGEMSEEAWRALAERSLQRFLEALRGPLVIGAAHYVGRIERARYFRAFRSEYLSRFPDMDPHDKASLEALVKSGASPSRGRWTGVTRMRAKR